MDVDTTEVLRAAASVRACAEDVRAAATGVAAQHSVAWRSPAATAFRAELEAVAVQIRAAAGALDGLAEALRRLAGAGS